MTDKEKAAEQERILRMARALVEARWLDWWGESAVDFLLGLVLCCSVVGLLVFLLGV